MRSIAGPALSVRCARGNRMQVADPHPACYKPSARMLLSPYEGMYAAISVRGHVCSYQRSLADEPSALPGTMVLWAGAHNG
jgi:hypothetical protein